MPKHILKDMSCNLTPVRSSGVRREFAAYYVPLYSRCDSQIGNLLTDEEKCVLLEPAGNVRLPGT